MNFFFTRANIIRGAAIYAAGDTIGQLIIGEFSIARLAGILFLGGVVYAFEIPNFLLWLNDRFIEQSVKIKLLTALIFSMYFNPLWIARHLLILSLFEGRFDNISWSLLSIGWSSFIYSFPIAFIVNYYISNEVPFKWRFTATGTFSGMMAVYYALSQKWFA